MRAYLHAPTFILANIVLDIEPLTALLLRVNYPLHGYFHTFIAAILVGVILAFTMLLLERILHPLNRKLRLEQETTLEKRHFIIAGILGTALHVLFDSPLYGEMSPLYPLTTNPLYGSISSLGIYLLTAVMGALGVLFYLLLPTRRIRD